MQWHSLDDVSPLPAVSVIMPVLNEEPYLADAVQAIAAQQYDGELEIVLAVGPSSDRTGEIALELRDADPRITVVANPSGRTPDALNVAIEAAHHDVIVRVDAHSELSDGYIARAVATLQRTSADNVGGIMGARGRTHFEVAVATAMTSPLGVGAASFHTGGSEGPADTVYLGVFRRSALERVGGYDPRFTRAQDWEMNLRIRQSGGTVWFDPELVVTYRPRPSVRRLARQYFEYGAWRRQVMRTHPETVSTTSALRYFAPPAAVVGSLVGAAAGLGGWSWGWLLPAGYAAIEVTAVAALARRAGRSAVWLPVVLPTMHWAWGIGFLTSRAKH